MKSFYLIIAFDVLCIFNCQYSQATEWLGSNLVTNGDFSGGEQGWLTPQGVLPTYANWHFNGGIASWQGKLGASITQSVSMQSGKRYRLSGDIYASACETQLQFYGYSTERWSGNFTNQSVESIVDVSNTSVYLHVHGFGSTGNYVTGTGKFDNISLRQVVYSPQISLLQKQNGVRLNSDSPGGASANISLTLNNSTPYADELTDWSMNWGDGMIQSKPTLNVSNYHTYSLFNGENSKTWVATFSATNQAETVLDTDTFTILRQPDVALTINGKTVENGSTLTLDILNDPTIELSLSNSIGYLEGANFYIPDKLNQSGSDLHSFLYSGILFDLSDIGKTYSLTASVHNTGLGVNSDSITLDLYIIPEPTSISLLAPNGGETYSVGTTNTITWESEGAIANVQLSYSTDNGSTWNVIKTVANTGSTTWTIPNTLSSECLLKISDADNPDIFDISDAPFTIQPAYPVVTSPNGGEQLYTSTERTIYWNTVGAISTVLIEYSTDNGLNWTPVEPANIGNTKSYKWTVPHSVSEQCLIRVSDAANPSSFDVSNAPFSIIASTPELIIPNDGENLLTGSVADIRWMTRGVIENIAIDYSIDNGSSWQPVSPANSGNSGHYQWTVPHQISDQCLVRVSNADHPEIFDISENTFQIVASLPTLVSPNGGEQLLSGTTVPIQWNTTGSISDILIEYSLDNGASWIAVTPPNTGNTGTYDWTVPYVMSKECLIRVSDASHPVVNDISDATFEISSLYLTTPNGREKMVVNSQYTIRWNSGEALSGDLINLQFSTNKGLGWTEIVTTENDGMYEWAVPEIESNQYLIQITDVNSPEIQDISENAFMVYQCHEQIASDLDGDCTVGLSDFAIMAEQWLYEGIILSRMYAFDDSPSWTTEGQWEFGQPLELGGASYGNPDPNSGYTGLNVYGINLSGDYNPAISGPYYLTTSVIDCTQYDNVKVSFMSWLNIDDSNYAKCSFEVSADGTEWISLWSNTPEPITDNDWNKMEFDISEYADDNPTLYLRWGYQIIDRAYPYSGWNIDDVEIWGTL